MIMFRPPQSILLFLILSHYYTIYVHRPRKAIKQQNKYKYAMTTLYLAPHNQNNDKTAHPTNPVGRAYGC